MSFTPKQKRIKKVCPDAPIRIRRIFSYQNSKIKGKILFRSFESLDLDLSTPDSGITYNKQSAPSKKRKTKIYSLELLDSIKKNLYEEHFSNSSKYALKLRQKIDDNNKKIVMNYVKKLLKKP